MNEQTPQVDSGRKKSGKGMIVILVILVLAIAGLLIWNFSIKKDMNTLLEEKEVQRVELQAELDSLMYEHDMIKEDYGTLSDSLFVKDSIIQANAQEIRKLLDTQWEYYKVKRKLELLQKVSQGYIRQMDSLYTVNKVLTEENIVIRQDLQEAREENEMIAQDNEQLNEKVGQASVLQVYNMIAMGVRDRGSSKEKDTDKASRVDKIKVCFTIGENKIVEAGTKDIFVRIARPDKLILTKDRSDTYTFEYQGEKIQYSIKKLIDYQNLSMNMCLYWEKSYKEKEIMKGTYHVEVFYGDEVIGHTQFILK
ncbi:MAG: hypothetical protein DRI97_02720 [Bacteroidetes bacterium]|nr:MAG: hypothetical protein DRI83_01320 [Bacteroidota bacterium]RLD58668.1 MAG: hypothetical protein DRI97_02720 [Bacteroidota bacterium]RLD79984.1 MAG: hypothetical protein DRJ15_08145 [Bacteroidota bacterium]